MCHPERMRGIPAAWLCISTLNDSSPTRLSRMPHFLAAKESLPMYCARHGRGTWARLFQGSFTALRLFRMTNETGVIPSGARHPCSLVLYLLAECLKPHLPLRDASPPCSVRSGFSLATRGQAFQGFKLTLNPNFLPTVSRYNIIEII